MTLVRNSPDDSDHATAAVEFDLPWPPARAAEVVGAYADRWGSDPVVRVRLADGTGAWLVTRYQEARTVLAGRQFAMRSKPLHRSSGTAAARVSRILRLDGAEHRRLRGLVMRLLDARADSFAPLVEAAVATCLDEMAAAGSPADLVAALAHPVPLLVTCRLLGLDYADRAIFHEQGVAELLRIGQDPGRANACATRTLDYVSAVVADRRRHPQDDLTSDFLAAGLSGDEVAENVSSLLIAGYEAPAGMIPKSTVELLRDPGLRAAFLAGPESRGRAIAELLRYHTIVQYGVDRVALDDVVLGGRAIARGETVIAVLAAANRDPDLAPEPNAMNAGCPAGGHLAFGHGPHTCLGRELSRVMLDITLTRLLERFPALRLIGDPADHPERDDYVIGGLRRLDVAW